MCGGGPSLPSETDPKEERLKAEADAARSANEKAAYERRARQYQTLLATGAQGNKQAASTSSVLAYGKDKLGS